MNWLMREQEDRALVGAFFTVLIAVISAFMAVYTWLKGDHQSLYLFRMLISIGIVGFLLFFYRLRAIRRLMKQEGYDT